MGENTTTATILTPPTIQEQFVLFSKFGDGRSDGKTMTLSQSDKWLKQAVILDNRRLTMTDTGLMFSKYKARTVTYNDYMKYLEEISRFMHMEFDEFKQKLIMCGPPGAKPKT